MPLGHDDRVWDIPGVEWFVGDTLVFLKNKKPALVFGSSRLNLVTRLTHCRGGNRIFPRCHTARKLVSDRMVGYDHEKYCRVVRTRIAV